MRIAGHQIPDTQDGRPAGLSITALLLFSIHILSLAPKWATLHISGLFILLTLLFSKKENWQSSAMRIYIMMTCAWLVPVIAAGIWQNIAGIETASDGISTLKVVLRMLGIGMGIIFLLQRGWLEPRLAAISTLVAFALNLAVGYYDWIIQGSGDPDVWRSFRMDGLIGNPNPFGTFTALTIIISAGLLRERARSAVLWTILALSFVAIWASGSRGAILATAVGLMALFPPVNRKNAIGLLLLMGAFFSIFFMTDMHFVIRGNTLRMELITYTIHKIMEAPFSGWGLHSFEAMPDRPWVASPHNMLLDLAVTSGVIAALGWFLSTALVAFRLARNHTWFSRIMLALLMTSIVSGVLEYSLLNSLHFQGIWMLVTAFSCWSLETRTARTERPRAYPKNESDTTAYKRQVSDELQSL